MCCNVSVVLTQLRTCNPRACPPTSWHKGLVRKGGPVLVSACCDVDWAMRKTREPRPALGTTTVEVECRSYMQARVSSRGQLSPAFLLPLKGKPFSRLQQSTTGPWRLTGLSEGALREEAEGPAVSAGRNFVCKH
jgi:hypothetical protein